MTTTIRSEATQSVVSVNGVDKFLIPSSGQVLPASFSNLKASASGLSANISVTADSLSLFDSSGGFVPVSSVNLTINTSATGANGLDTGTLAASTWYSVWVIWNGSTVAGLVSLSTTSPTMPSGYTHKVRVGWVRTDGTVNKYPLSFAQTGRSVQYKVTAGTNLTVLPVMVSGTQSNVAVALGAFIPSTAAAILGTLFANITALGNTAGVGPTSSQLIVNLTSPSGGALLQASVQFGFRLDTMNIWYTGSASANGSVSCLGWEDNF